MGSSWTLDACAPVAVLVVFLARQIVISSNRSFWSEKALTLRSSIDTNASWYWGKRVLLLRFPWGMEAGVLVTAFMAAARVRTRAENITVPMAAVVPGLVEGVILSCWGAFGGACLACLLVQAPAFVLTEELALPSAAVAWALVGGRWWGADVSTPGLRALLSCPGIHHGLVFIAEAFRASLVCEAVDAAREVMAGDRGWTLAVTVGVVAGCGGVFLHFDRGLSALAGGVPWTVQSAMYGAAAYYYMVGDVETGDGSPGGNTATAAPRLALEAAASLVSILYTSTALIKTHLGPRFNPFYPGHRLAYILLGLKPPLVYRPSPQRFPVREEERLATQGDLSTIQQANSHAIQGYSPPRQHHFPPRQAGYSMKSQQRDQQLEHERRQPAGLFPLLPFSSTSLLAPRGGEGEACCIDFGATRLSGGSGRGLSSLSLAAFRPDRRRADEAGQVSEDQSEGNAEEPRGAGRQADGLVPFRESQSQFYSRSSSLLSSRGSGLSSSSRSSRLLLMPRPSTGSNSHGPTRGGTANDKGVTSFGSSSRSGGRGHDGGVTADHDDASQRRRRSTASSRRYPNSSCRRERGRGSRRSSASGFGARSMAPAESASRDGGVARTGDDGMRTLRLGIGAARAVVLTVSASLVIWIGRLLVYILSDQSVPLRSARINLSIKLGSPGVAQARDTTVAPPDSGKLNALGEHRVTGTPLCPLDGGAGVSTEALLLDVRALQQEAALLLPGDKVIPGIDGAGRGDGSKGGVGTECTDGGFVSPLPSSFYLMKREASFRRPPPPESADGVSTADVSPPTFWSSAEYSPGRSTPGQGSRDRNVDVVDACPTPAQLLSDSVEEKLSRTTADVSQMRTDFENFQEISEESDDTLAEVSDARVDGDGLGSVAVRNGAAPAFYDEEMAQVEAAAAPGEHEATIPQKSCEEYDLFGADRFLSDGGTSVDKERELTNPRLLLNLPLSQHEKLLHVLHTSAVVASGTVDGTTVKLEVSETFAHNLKDYVGDEGARAARISRTILRSHRPRSLDTFKARGSAPRDDGDNRSSGGSGSGGLHEGTDGDIGVMQSAETHLKIDSRSDGGWRASFSDRPPLNEDAGVSFSSKERIGAESHRTRDGTVAVALGVDLVQPTSTATIFDTDTGASRASCTLAESETCGSSEDEGMTSGECAVPPAGLSTPFEVPERFIGSSTLVTGAVPEDSGSRSAKGLLEVREEYVGARDSPDSIAETNLLDSDVVADGAEAAPGSVYSPHRSLQNTELLPKGDLEWMITKGAMDSGHATVQVTAESSSSSAKYDVDQAPQFGSGRDLSAIPYEELSRGPQEEGGSGIVILPDVDLDVTFHPLEAFRRALGTYGMSALPWAPTSTLSSEKTSPKREEEAKSHPTISAPSSGTTTKTATAHPDVPSSSSYSSRSLYDDNESISSTGEVSQTPTPLPQVSTPEHSYIEQAFARELSNAEKEKQQSTICGTDEMEVEYVVADSAVRRSARKERADGDRDKHRRDPAEAQDVEARGRWWGRLRGWHEEKKVEKTDHRIFDSTPTTSAAEVNKGDIEDRQTDKPSKGEMEPTTGAVTISTEKPTVASFVRGEDGSPESSNRQGILSGGRGECGHVEEDSVDLGVGTCESERDGIKTNPRDLGSAEEPNNNTRDAAKIEGDSGDERLSEEPTRPETREKRTGKPDDALGGPETEHSNVDHDALSGVQQPDQLSEEAGKLENDEVRTTSKDDDDVEGERDVVVERLSRSAQQGQEDGGPDAADKLGAAQQPMEFNNIMCDAKSGRNVAAESERRLAKQERDGVHDASHETDTPRSSWPLEFDGDERRNDIRDAKDSLRHINVEGQLTQGKEESREMHKGNGDAGPERREKQKKPKGVLDAHEKSYRLEKHERQGRGSKGGKSNVVGKSYRPQEHQDVGRDVEKRTDHILNERTPDRTAHSDPPKMGFKVVVGTVAALVYYAVWAAIAAVVLG